jgi:hypothetical protein
MADLQIGSIAGRLNEGSYFGLEMDKKTVESV